MLIVMGQLMVSLFYPMMEPLHVIIPGMIFDALFWGLLIFKIASKPKQWGLGVGIFLSALLVFQVFLWICAISDPARVRLGIFANISTFIIFELPLLISAVCCCLLRWFTPLAQRGARLPR